MTVDQTTLAVLSPMWQRIARGEVDLSQYSDEEILSARITMADGRLLPAPKVMPDTFIAEQQRRGLRQAQERIRDGAVKALEVFTEILEDDLAEDKDRLKAGEWFLNRFLGKEPQQIHVTHDGEDPRELLLRRLLAARQGLPAPEEDVVDAEVVDPVLEELL